jgi:prefoldin subunit 5
MYMNATIISQRNAERKSSIVGIEKTGTVNSEALNLIQTPRENEHLIAIGFSLGDFGHFRNFYLKRIDEVTSGLAKRIEPIELRIKEFEDEIEATLHHIKVMEEEATEIRVQGSLEYKELQKGNPTTLRKRTEKFYYYLNKDIGVIQSKINFQRSRIPLIQKRIEDMQREISMITTNMQGYINRLQLVVDTIEAEVERRLQLMAPQVMASKEPMAIAKPTTPAQAPIVVAPIVEKPKATVVSMPPNPPKKQPKLRVATSLEDLKALVEGYGDLETAAKKVEQYGAELAHKFLEPTPEMSEAVEEPKATVEAVEPAKTKRRVYDQAFKDNALALVRSGKSCSAVERELEVGRGTVSRWVRESEPIAVTAAPAVIA